MPTMSVTAGRGLVAYAAVLRSKIMLLTMMIKSITLSMYIQHSFLLSGGLVLHLTCGLSLKASVAFVFWILRQGCLLGCND